MPETEAWTIGRLLEWTTKYLRDHGAESARLDAELLLAEACHCQRIGLYTSFADEPPEDARVAFRELVKRRAEGMPVAYLLGRREFYSLPFHVTPDVLIPRPETEFLLIRLLDLAKQKAPTGAGLRIADVGTGSGILAVCAANELSEASVVAIDMSAKALGIARSNAETHGAAERIEFVESDLFAALDGEPFDFVVSNPPYITTAEMATLSRDVSQYEPHLALEAGPKGTEVIERLIPQAAERLRPGGWLLIEISPQIEGATRELIAADGRYDAASVGKDLAGLARVVQAQRKA